MSAALRGKSRGGEVLRRLNAQREVFWTEGMRNALASGYWRGWSTDTIAFDIGVGREVLQKEMNRLQLPRGRWVTIAQRRAALEQCNNGE
jgi:hypothetical protein